MNATVFFFFFQAEDGIRDFHVTGVQTCALPISPGPAYGRCDNRTTRQELAVAIANEAGTGGGGAGILDTRRDYGRGRADSALAAMRRAIQVTLGVLWLLDAALQFQPYMFTKAFVRDAILSTAAGNPAIVARPIIWAATLMLGHIVVANATFATLQLALALGLFWRTAVRMALAASIVWSLAVWWLGEGFGGVLT